MKKNETLTIRLDTRLSKLLRHESRRTGRSRSDVARDALRRWLSVRELVALQAKVMPYARAAGFYSDEDVFKQIS